MLCIDLRSAYFRVGRICSRLTAPYVDDVLTAILDLCTRLETFSAWHGACFALAELGRRCLLLPEKLPRVILTDDPLSYCFFAQFRRCIKYFYSF